ncbi:uncharacterized protein FIBRA_04828 [Fibroporia radiculosa]|uniref:Uncharacterized protein n=1 Tax=Fibroporia radiculosa TaxID=599839 RepID=J4IAD5_9APHY|nr:uncharacterized protein FIBRA_04828 [Fibroporia radiculosa]CCM02721.1 predicted protein [Fibroporia radiculosa]
MRVSTVVGLGSLVIAPAFAISAGGSRKPKVPDKPQALKSHLLQQEVYHRLNHYPDQHVYSQADNRPTSFDELPNPFDQPRPKPPSNRNKPLPPLPHARRMFAEDAEVGQYGRGEEGRFSHQGSEPDRDGSSRDTWHRTRALLVRALLDAELD